MARIDEIKELIVADIESRPELAEASSTSVTAIWRLLVYVAAFFSLQIENLFTLFKSDVDIALQKLKPHKATWYQEKALLFQYGSDLAEGLDTYDNSALTEEQIELQKIIAQCAVTENAGNLTVKIAKEVSGELAPLDAAEYDAFQSYINEFKDAGVNVVILSFQPDRLKLKVDIHYNPLLLNSLGERIDGTNDTPVEDAVKSFLRDTSFNGLYVRSDHEEVLKNIDGVVVAKIKECQAARFDNANFNNVDLRYQPYAGFLRLYDNADLTINYIEWDV